MASVGSRIRDLTSIGVPAGPVLDLDPIVKGVPTFTTTDALDRIKSEELDFEAVTFSEPIAQEAELQCCLDVKAGGTAAETKVLLEEQHELHVSAQCGQVVSNGALNAEDGGSPTAIEGAPSSPASPLRKLGPSDFELLRVVGKGSFGKVFQVRRTDSGEIFAMKVMCKNRIAKKEHSEYIRAESKILQSLRHSFIVTLRFSFQTPQKLYLVMDFVNGGHLFYNLYKEGHFLSETARFFAAEIVCAVGHLHSLGVVHRDLKPENILLDRGGHVRLTDFGLAKEDMSDEIRANSFIGTVQYMAPEIINATGHGKSVDWWSVGILTYEMLVGYTPFKNKSNAALQKQIVGGKLKIPQWFKDDERNFIKGLLQKDPKKRLGYGENGFNDIKRDPFFKGINWATLEKRGLTSPYEGKVKAQNDDSVECFDKIWTDQKVVDSPPASPAQNPLDAQASFLNFTYTAPSMLAAQFQQLKGAT